jgi:hypothetical protein
VEKLFEVGMEIYFKLFPCVASFFMYNERRDKKPQPQKKRELDMSIMNRIVGMLSGNKGANVSVSWKREAKVKKSCPILIEKQTSAIVRAGIDYANLAIVKDSGIEVGELPWGTWNVFPFSIVHKGVEYIRLYQAGGISFSPKVQWFANGEPVEKASVEEYLLASEKGDGAAPACFTIKAKDVLTVGGVAI